MLDRDLQIALMEKADERRAAHVREWLSDAEYKAVLHRYDHEFSDAPERQLKYA